MVINKLYTYELTVNSGDTVAYANIQLPAFQPNMYLKRISLSVFSEKTILQSNQCGGVLQAANNITEPSVVVSGAVINTNQIAFDTLKEIYFQDGVMLNNVSYSTLSLSVQQNVDAAEDGVYYFTLLLEIEQR